MARKATKDGETLTPEERTARRETREREKIRARRALRATYDLPPALRRRIKDLADEQRIPASQLVTLAILRFLKAYDRGEVSLSQYKRPSRSPRYDWNLVFPSDLTAPIRGTGRTTDGDV